MRGQDPLFQILESRPKPERKDKTEEYFRLFLENSTDVVAVVDRDATIRFASSSVERVLGYRREELVGKPFSDYLYPADAPMMRQILPDAGEAASVRSGPPASVVPQAAGAQNCAEFRFRHKDGTWRSLEAVRQTLAEGSRVYGVVNCRDVTDRKRAEQALVENQAQLAAIVGSTMDGVIAVDADQCITLFNPAAEKMFGRQAEEVAGMPLSALLPERYHDAHRRFVDSFGATNATNRSIGHLGILFGRKANGEEFPVEISISQGEVRGKKIYTAIVRDITERVRAEREVLRRLRQVRALHTIDQAIGGSLDLGFTLGVFLEQVTTELGVDAADVLVLNPHTQTLEFSAGRGFRTKALDQTRLRVGEGYAGRAALESRTIGIPDLPETGGEFRRSPLFKQEQFISYYAVPLKAKGQVKGVLEVFHRKPLSPDEEWLDFLETLGGQAAIAIDSATLFDNLQRSNAELALAYDTTIEGWSRALDLRDKETEGHTQRVTELSVGLGRAMGMSEMELVHVRRGGLLHDIGKMGIPDSILLKPGPLSEEEWEIMRTHPEHARQLLSPITYLRPALDIPYCHHERWDGAGYPRGLKGEEIPLAARVFAVVDVWDALLSNRPYRPAWERNRVREYISGKSGVDFDPKVVKAFFDLIEKK